MYSRGHRKFDVGLGQPPRHASGESAHLTADIYKREDPDFINHNDISFADKVDHMFFGWRHVHYTSDEQLEEGHADFAIICHETDHDRKNLDFLEETFIWSHCVGARYRANPGSTG